MARIRTVKPDAWQDPRVGRLSVPARLLWVVLITMADDAGRFLAMPAVIFGHGYPHDPGSLPDIPALLTELEDADLIALYEAEDVPYGLHPKWADHQRISHPTPSRIPAPPENFVSRLRSVSAPLSGDAPEVLRGEGRGGDRRGEEGNGPRASAPAGGQASNDPLATIWGRDVRPLLEQVPEWDAWLSRGGDSAVYSVLQGNPSAPWQEIAAHALSDRQAGSLTTDDPRTALRLKAQDRAKRDGDARTDPDMADRAAEMDRAARAAAEQRTTTEPVADPLEGIL